MDDLKLRECPSPWCRSTVIETLFSPWSKRFYAKCQSCKAEGPVEATEADAIAAWNTRAADAELDRLRAENERLRGWLDSVKPKPFGFGIGDTNVVGVQKTLPKYLTGGQP